MIEFPKFRLTSQALNSSAKKLVFFNNILTSFSQLKKSLAIKSKLSFVAIIVALLIIAGAVLFISGRPDKIVRRQLVQQSISIGKSFDFPIREKNGQATDGVLRMTITTAEKTNQILIKGRPATTRGGKSFLIINLELDNPTNSELNLTPVELIRLVDGSGKKYAPDIHNERVAVKPISTKKTRVGFVINETDLAFQLQIGEVGGKKELTNITF